MKRVLVWGSALAALAILLLPGPAGAVAYGCYWVTQTATVCVVDYYGEVCVSTTETVYLCFDGGTGGTGGGTGGSGGGGGGGGGGVGGFLDSNNNSIIDNWRYVVTTADPCAGNFDENDRLGTNNGGTNSVRPGHSGVDIQADDKDPVFAMATGIVSFAGTLSTDPACGQSVRINNFDGSRVVYCHLREYLVPQGSAVTAGQLVGRADSTGNSTGHHLHVSYKDRSGNRREYFNYTDTRPTASQLNKGGC